ncbi:GAF domain-containing protein [Chloroflexus sp.]|uniref:GAF domain-containing protein n=1 Tax=Chloroflexus sp. TaxID=1904827 RepID=UPI00298ED593|nr:GAF domain-containing protein [Chloroflexus sp.]MDW8402635.1 GAF domain-containing protein [Chloroflexus sp.]
MNERWNAAQTRLLADVGILLVSLNQLEAFQQIARRLVPLLGDWCAIIIRDEHQQARRVAMACADPRQQPLAEQLVQVDPFVDPASPPVRVLDSGQLLLLCDLPDDYSEQPEFSPAYRAILRQIKLRHLLCVPMQTRAQVNGVLVFILTNESHRRFTNDDIAFATELAQRMALAVENVILYRTMQRRLNQLLLVQRVAGMVNSALQTEILCHLVVRQLQSVFGYQLVSIYLLQDGALRLQAVVGYDQVLPVIQLHEGVAGRVMRSGKAEFVRDASLDPDFIEVRPGTTQCIIVPLRHAEGQPAGVLIVESTGNPALDDEDFFLLSLLADQISVALLNSFLFARMLETFERFRSLIELAGNVIICLSPDLRITEFNRMAEQIFGRARGEMLGADYPTTLLSEAERPLFAALVREVMSSGNSRSFETTLVARGRERCLFWTITCRRQLTGEIAELLLVGQDLTEQREKSIALLQYERRLQTLERLESMAVMAGSIAHDFNNLLNVIIGHANLLQVAYTNEPFARQSLHHLINAARQAGDLAHQLLHFAGEERLHLQHLNLNQLIAEALPLLQDAIGSTVKVHLELDPAVATVMADPVQMRQILMNLVINAAEALPDRSGCIWIQTGQSHLDADHLQRLSPPHQLAPGEYVMMAVRDNGIGIDPAIRQRIFDPFFTTKAHGHGLGLAGVLNIVRRHGGALEVDSQPGRGSTFTVWLAPQPALAELPSRPSESRAGLLVLVVDDNDEVRSLTERMLVHAGYQVKAVASGREALQLVNEDDEIACALIDITLADASGYDICRRIAARNARIPLALISGYPVDVDHLVDVPVVATLQKPFRAEELLNLVRRLIYRRETQEAC